VKSTIKSIQELGLPMHPSFRKKILPLLILYWIIAVVLAIVGQPAALVVALWGSITTIMLWPVSEHYGEGRKPWFVIGVLSMIGIPLFGYMIISATSATVKFAALLALVVDIGIWGVPLCMKNAFGKPVKMLFRPDLLLGDGRILAGGIVAVGLGIKLIFTNAPHGDVPIGNWYALFFVIVFGLLQIIPMRGMWKIRNRISAILFNKSTSLTATALREIYLFVAITLLLFGFHNFFGGVIPFTKNVLAGSIPGLLIMLASASATVILRSWYKKNVIGAPFIVESYSQSLVKHAIFAVGLIIFMYGFVNVMVGGFPRVPNSGSFQYLTIIGGVLVAYGVIMLVPVRSWAQGNQRDAIVGQMVYAILPRLESKHRALVMKKVIDAVAGLSEKRRSKMVKVMVNSLKLLHKNERDAVMQTQIDVLSELPADKRLALMKAIDEAIVSQ